MIRKKQPSNKTQAKDRLPTPTNNRPTMTRDWAKFRRSLPGRKSKPPGTYDETRYKPEFDALAIELLQEGKSIYAMAADMGVSVDEVGAWRRKHSSFDQCIKKGLILSQAYWEEIARQNIISPTPGRFNVALWIFNMKNRFGWADRQDINQTTTNENTLKIDLSSLTDDQLDSMEEMDAKTLKRSLMVLNGGKGRE